MKNLFTLLIFATFLYGFTIINAQMKFDFEEWTDSTDFSRPNPTDFWADPNAGAREVLYSEDITATPTAEAVCTKSSDFKTGFLAAELTINAYSLETPFGTYDRTLNGWLYTGVMTFDPMTYITTPDLRIPNTEKWEVFSGWYKYEPATDDSCVFFAELYAADSTVVATAEMRTGEAQTEYTEFSIPFVYSDENADVTHMGVYISASNTAVNTGSYGGEAGSKLIIDDLEFSKKPSAINQTLNDKSIYRVYSSNQGNILHVKNAKNTIIEIYSISGKILLAKSIRSDEENISISNLNSGLFIYHISKEGKFVTSGKFIK